MFELALIVIVVLVAAIWLFNRLIKERNQVFAAWSDIDVQLKRRHDLVPQLVSAVKAYADYEKATMMAVTELRAQSQAASHLPEKAAYEDRMEQALHKLIVVAEDYPELKADENFRQLHTELVDVENHIQYARRFYNGSVRIFNTLIQSFPHLLLAQALGFKVAEFFEVAGANERVAPEVKMEKPS